METSQHIPQLVADLPLIQILDLNPVVAREDRLFIADARIALQLP